MAIYWVDPYIESPSGGVDGTTGVGTVGSYANPYSVDNLTAPTGWNNGDEIRIKALPANPWITGPIWRTGVVSLASWTAGYYGVYWGASPDAHSFLKYTTLKGDEQYLNWDAPGRLHLEAKPGFWQTPVPHGDVTKPAYKLDPQYYLSNLARPNHNMFFRGANDRAVTVTAGWVSESARGGETIIHRVDQATQTEFWFGYTSIDRNKMVVDAPELTISHTSEYNNRKIHIYGETVELHDVNLRNTYNTSNYLSIYTTLTFKANCIACGGYIQIYSPNSTGSEYPPIVGGVNRDIKHILGGFQVEFVDQGGSYSHATHLKFKTLLSYIYRQYIPVKLSYYDNFYFKVSNKQGTSNPTEMAIDPAVNADPAPAFRYEASSLSTIYDSDAAQNTRIHKQPIYTYDKYLTRGARVDIAKSSKYFKELRLPPGATLENTTSHGVVSSSQSDHDNSTGRFWGVDKNSGRRMAFAPSGSFDKELMMMYNSTEYGGKLAYHLMPHEVHSFDRVYIDMPTGFSEIPTNSNFRLKYTLGGAVQGKVDLKAYIEGNSTDDWRACAGSWISVDASAGGDDAVIYAPFTNFQYYIEGSQQLTAVLRFKNSGFLDTTYAGQCAKICIKSIELEVV